MELLLLDMFCFLNQILAVSLNMEKLISATKTCLSMEDISLVNILIGSSNDEKEEYIELCQKSLFLGFENWYF